MKLFSFLFGKPNIARMEADGNTRGILDALHRQKDPDGSGGEREAIILENILLRSAALSALVRLGAHAAPVIIDALKNPEWGYLKGRGAREVMSTSTSHYNDERHPRVLAVRALGEIKDPRAFEPLANELANSKSRGVAARSLGTLGDTRAVKPLIDALLDESARSYAATALGELVDARAVAPRITMLSDANWGYRVTAARALGKLGDARAVAPLIKMLADSQKACRLSAALALGELKAQEAAEPLYSLAKARAEDVRDAAIIALGKVGDIRAAEFLRESLIKSDREAGMKIELIKNGYSSPAFAYIDGERKALEKAEVLATLTTKKDVRPFLPNLLTWEMYYVRDLVVPQGRFYRTGPMFSPEREAIIGAWLGNFADNLANAVTVLQSDSSTAVSESERVAAGLLKMCSAYSEEKLLQRLENVYSDEARNNLRKVLMNVERITMLV